MNKEERKVYQREYRKRSKQPVNGGVNVNNRVNSLPTTDPCDVELFPRLPTQHDFGGVNSVNDVNSDVILPDNWPKYVTLGEVPEFRALEERVALLEETVAKLAASQAKVSVVPGSAVRSGTPKWGPFSKEAQAAGKMVNASPLGRCDGH